MNNDWKNDRAEGSMKQHELENMKKASEVFKKIKIVEKTPIEQLADNISAWENNNGESFTDYFMHDNVKDRSWAFWVLGKGFHEHANRIIDELLAGETCLDQDMLYEIYSEDVDDREELNENADKNKLLWAEFLLATPFYTEKITKWFEEGDNKI